MLIGIVKKLKIVELTESSLPELYMSSVYKDTGCTFWV